MLSNEGATASVKRSARKPKSVLARNPLWYKDAIIYELHVRAFADSNGDGIGDFGGLITKLDYLQDLGVTALWLLPFYPSPLKDDGYDISDYTDVHPSYGTLTDFKRFLQEAHARELRVITELPINHTSSEHPWFERARRAPQGSKHRDFYVWSDSPQRYGEARIIFEDFETSNWTWDPVAKAYYWHRFYSHQPDLNFDSPHVQKAVFKALDFWMELGVDGLRLDAIPYLYEREGTNCENLPETHAFLKKLRAYVDERYEDRMLLAEANQWPEDAAAYFGGGDECHMNFHFPVMPRLFMSVQLESRTPIVDILEQTPEIPESCQWATFLRNHDELTLEMVTDEDRDYMYRTYAEDPRMRVNVGIRRRLAPLLKLRAKIELMNGLLMSLPGTPVLYYGDEIGQGDNVYLGDRNGVRTPMQWSGDRNAGFSRANPQRLFLPVIIDPEYHYESVNVDAQQSNSESLLWWMKRLIAMRKNHIEVFGRGNIRFIEAENPKVLCFTRSFQGKHLLVVANLARSAQYAELDLSQHEGMVPLELAGGTAFPKVGSAPYLLMLGGYDFLWFELTKTDSASAWDESELPRLEGASMERLFRGRLSKALESALRDYVRRKRWFRSKTRTIKSVQCADFIPLAKGTAPPSLVVLRVEYGSDLPETYLLPVGFVGGEEADSVLERHPDSVIASARLGSKSPRSGLLFEPTQGDTFGKTLLSLLAKRRSLEGVGKLTSHPRRALRPVLSEHNDDLEPWMAAHEQSNTTIFYGHQLALKLFRQPESGENPDVEISGFLTDKGFPNTPPVLGTLEYDGPGLSGTTFGLVQGFVSSMGNAWDLTLDWVHRALEEAASLTYEHAGEVPPERPDRDVLSASEGPVPERMAQFVGGYLGLARLLGQRTADLHLCLASDVEDERFRPEPFAGHYQRSIMQAARDRLAGTMKLLRKQLSSLPESARPLASEVLGLRETLTQQLADVTKTKIEASRIRCHGDYHLGQVLYDGRDFVIIDFEGEPAVSIGVRRLKRSALYDVCGMLRSFHYAAVFALYSDLVRPDDRTRLSTWADAWYEWVCGAFLGAYLGQTQDAPFLPQTDDQRRALIRTHLIDKCAYELAYELNNRPEWVHVPLAGLRALAK